MISTRQLGRHFRGTWALHPLDLEIEAGTFLGILGRNGAGKTTLVRLLTGQLNPSQGTARVAGLDLAQRPVELRRRIGVMPEPRALLDNLTGTDYLGFVGRLHGLHHGLIEDRTRELSHLLDMDFGVSCIADFSFGMKKKTALAASLLHGPELLFLDEPFEGLDPVSADALEGLLADFHARGTTILMASHLLDRAERLCNRLLILDQGRLLAEGGTLDLLSGERDLEELFLGLVGRGDKRTLTWM
nr:ABC transporter ATP-binding protein [uncultured Holophaga sp.]